MRKAAPLGIILIAVAAILVVLLRGDRPQRGQAPTRPEHTTRSELAWTPPDLGGAPPSVVDGPDTNVTGDVTDQSCLPVDGVIVEAVEASGRVLAHSTTNPDGSFAMLVPEAPPFAVQVRGNTDDSYPVSIVPIHHISLIVKAPEARRETLYVKAVHGPLSTGKELKLKVIDAAAQMARGEYVMLPDSPWRIDDLPFGTYDVRVWSEDLSGIARGFEFGLESREVEVVLSAPAGVIGESERPVRALLIPDPPLGGTLSRDFRESDGRDGSVRGSLLDTRRLVRKINFRGVPAGEYRIVIVSPGREATQQKVTLAAGEILDLGKIPLEAATGAALFRLNDRHQETTEYGYQLTLYTTYGTVLEYKTDPGDPAQVKIRNLSAGTWHYRAERRMGGGGLRTTSHDRPFLVERDKTTEVEIDLTWRIE